MSRPRVLLIGPVPGLSRALYRRKVPFVVWNDTEIRVRGAEDTVIEKFSTGGKLVEGIVQPLLEESWFTHVIAGRPAAEITASHARKAAEARSDESPVILRFGGSEGWVDALDDRGLPAGDPEDTVHCSVESFVQDGEDRFHCVVEWHEDGALLAIPAKFDEGVLQSVLDLHRRVIETSEISWGMLHVEMNLDGDEASLVSVSLSPPDGPMVELLSLAYDIDAWNVLIDVEMGSTFEVPDEPRVEACAWWLWGPPDAVVRAEGDEALSSIPGVERVQLVVRDGVVEPGGPVPGHLGYVLFRASNREALWEAVAAARNTLVLRAD